MDETLIFIGIIHRTPIRRRKFFRVARLILQAAWILYDAVMAVKLAPISDILTGTYFCLCVGRMLNVLPTFMVGTTVDLGPPGIILSKLLLLHISASTLAMAVGCLVFFSYGLDMGFRDQSPYSLLALVESGIVFLFIFGNLATLVTFSIVRTCQPPNNPRSNPNLNLLRRCREDTFANCKNDVYHNDCAICLSKYEENTRVRVLPCKHSYCHECANDWFTQSVVCPICGREIGNDAETN